MKLKRDKSTKHPETRSLDQSKFIVSGLLEKPIDEIVRIRRYLRDLDRVTIRRHESAEKSETND